MMVILFFQVAFNVCIYYFLFYKNVHNVAAKEESASIIIVNYLASKIENVEFLNRRNAIIMGLIGPYVSFADFKKMLQLNHDPSADNIEAYEFIPKLNSSDISVFNAYCNLKIVSGCFLKELKVNATVTGDPNSFKAVTVDIDRNYYPVLYIYPLSEEISYMKNLIGLDLGSFPVGLDIVTQLAVSNGTNSHVTRRAQLVVPSSNPNAYGILIGIAVTDEQSLLLGYTTVVIRVETILDRAVESTQYVTRDEVAIAIFDTTEDGVVNILANNVSLLYREEELKSNTPFRNTWFETDIAQYDVKKNLLFLNRNYVIYFDYSRKILKYSNAIVVSIIVCCIFVLIDIIILAVLFLRTSRRKRLRAIRETTRAHQMLSYCNHEIRNPLNIVKSMVDYTLQNLINAWKNSEVAPPLDTCISDLTVASRACDFMEHIVSDVLVLQRLEDDMLTLNPSVCKLIDVLEEIKHSISQKIDENKSITLTINCPDTLYLFMDEYRFKQILLNLLSNAFKYTTEGFIDIIVELETECVVVSVKDTGRGIRDKYKPLIFEAHAQINPNDISRYGSFGLGLYLVRTLSHRMEWQVGFHSIENVGSTFWCKIPNRFIRDGYEEI
jgi:signal transduction histidine kinase